MARTLVSLRFRIDNPDRNIRASLDEPVEQIATADFYNGPAAEWLERKTPFRWIKLGYEELDSVETVRDMAKICYAHLADEPPGLSALPDDIVGGNDE